MSSSPLRPIALLLCLTGMSVGADAAAQAGPPPGPPPRPIPGITAPDSFPNACVDCHVLYPDRGLDVRLSTLMARWRDQVEPRLLGLAQASAPGGRRLGGRHPDVTEALADIPNGCLECHGKDARRAPPFAALLHAVHLSGGAENHFVSIFGGECTYCHKLDQANGRWSVPSRPEQAPAGAGSGVGQRGRAGTPPPSSR